MDFLPYLASHSSVATETSQMALPSLAPQSVEVWSKPLSKEGHCNLEAETVFPHSLVSHCSVVTVTSSLALYAHAQKSVQLWSKSVSKRGHCNLEGKTVFRPSRLALQVGV
jgi:hypothetical protein